jgi:hypothetical protein
VAKVVSIIIDSTGIFPVETSSQIKNQIRQSQLTVNEGAVTSNNIVCQTASYITRIL